MEYLVPSQTSQCAVHAGIFILLRRNLLSCLPAYRCINDQRIAWIWDTLVCQETKRYKFRAFYIFYCDRIINRFTEAIIKSKCTGAPNRQGAVRIFRLGTKNMKRVVGANSSGRDCKEQRQMWWVDECPNTLISKNKKCIGTVLPANLNRRLYLLGCTCD